MKILTFVLIFTCAVIMPSIAQQKLLLDLNVDKLKEASFSDMTNNEFEVKLHGSVDIVKGIKGKALKFANGAGFFSIDDPKGKLTPADSISVEFWVYPTKWSSKGDVIINKGWAKGWGDFS